MSARTMGIRLRVDLATLVATLLVCSSLAAQSPTLTEVFPPGGQRGTSLEIVAKGKFAEWPLRAFVHGSDGEVASIETVVTKTKGRWKVTIGPSTPPGVYWLRVDGTQGLSNALPFVVGLLDEHVEGASELEPRADPRFVANGRLAKRGEVDSYAFDLAQGQTVGADVLAQRVLGSPMDASLQISTHDGFVLADNDDDQGNDPRIIFTAPKSGRYLARIFAFPSQPNSSISFSGAATYIYRLTVTSGAFVDHTRPLVVSSLSPTVVPHGWNLPTPVEAHTPRDLVDTCAHVPEVRQVTAPILLEDTISGRSEQSIPPHCALTGNIGTRDEIDRYAVSVEKGQHLKFRVRGQSLGSPIAPLLEIDAPGAKKPIRLHARGSRADVSSDVRVAASGVCHVRVADLFGHGGPRFVYALDIEPIVPHFTLETSVREVTLCPRTKTEIVVRLTRHAGFASPVEISIADAPFGVRAKPVVSKPQKKATEEHKLVLESEFGPFVGSFRVVGRALEKPDDASVSEVFADVVRPHAATRGDRIWVSVRDRASCTPEETPKKAKK